MKDFFITLEVPELNAHYAQNLQQLVLNINTNFAKVASLPFLKGDSGVSIETHDERLFEYIDNEKVYTDFGRAIIKCIYGVDSFPTYEFTVNGVHSYDELKNIESISVFYDRFQGLKYLTVPFMFHDVRKNELGSVIGSEVAEKFIDMSTFVIGKTVIDMDGNTKWFLEKNNFEPKLYYNTETQKFCWTIGSQQTNIIAQGVEGRPGESVYAKYCIGSFNGDDRSYIYIDGVLNEEDLPEIDFDINDYFTNVTNDNIKNGDFVLVMYDLDINNNVVTDLAFGKVMEVGGRKCIPYVVGTTLYNATQNTTLKSLLDGIGKTANGVTTTPNVRGLYVYKENEQSAMNNDTTPRTPHMLWVDDEDVAHISKLNTNRVDSDGNYINQTTQNNPIINPNGVFKFDYNKLKAQDINAQIFTNDTGSKIFCYGNETTENTFDLDKNVVKSEDNSGSPFFIPNPHVVYKEPPAKVYKTGETLPTSTIGETTGETTSTTAVPITKPIEEQINIGNILQTITDDDSNLIIKNNEITMGGTYEFSLPSFALLDLEQNNTDKLYNTIQFRKVANNTQDPIVVNLQKVELFNNNTITDNTSNGWRFFYDNLLLGSPISDDEFYVGTNNVEVFATYNNIRYKANIVITAIQYKIGYDDNGNICFKQGVWSNSINDTQNWSNVTFSNKTAVTDVIYYILPTTTNDNEVDICKSILENSINSGNSTSNNSQYLCMRYRLFFKEKNTDKESVDTIFINPINETYNTTGTENITKTIDEGAINDNEKCYPLLNVSGVNIIGIKNLILVKPPTKFLKINTSQAENNREYGKYNDFVWCYGNPYIGMKLNSAFCGLGCGKMLPINANQTLYKWIIGINPNTKYTIPKIMKYTFSTDGISNKLSNNMSDQDCQTVKIGGKFNINSQNISYKTSLTYIPQSDNGWYINNQHIQTDNTTNEDKFYMTFDDYLYKGTFSGGSVPIEGDGENSQMNTPNS